MDLSRKKSVLEKIVKKKRSPLNRGGGGGPLVNGLSPLKCFFFNEYFPKGLLSRVLGGVIGLVLVRIL